MGREAVARCAIGAQSEDVKALLESRELILRGAALKRRYALADLQRPRVEGDALCFEAGAEAVALQLGAAEAARWLQRITTPPPTLAAKLGIGPESPAAVFGSVDDDAELAAALQGARCEDPQQASVLVAVVLTAEELAAALRLHAGLPCRGLWLVHAKGGKSAALGDGAIREALRALGYKDTKSCAVSERLTATRYQRP